MPNYTFECVQENDGCGCIFEIYCTLNQYSSKFPVCPQCHQSAYVQRNFLEDLPHSHEAHKTVGSLVDKNTKNLSDEAKLNLWKKHNEYRFVQARQPLPKDMIRMKKSITPPKPRQKRKVNKK